MNFLQGLWGLRVDEWYRTAGKDKNHRQGYGIISECCYRKILLNGQDLPCTVPVTHLTLCP